VARFVVQTGEVLFVNQREEVISRAEADVARIPRGRSGQGMRGFEERKKEGRAKYSADEIDEFRQAYLHEERRGSTPRYWEEVKEGRAFQGIERAYDPR